MLICIEGTTIETNNIWEVGPVRYSNAHYEFKVQGFNDQNKVFHLSPQLYCERGFLQWQQLSEEDRNKLKQQAEDKLNEVRDWIIEHWQQDKGSIPSISYIPNEDTRV